MIFPRSVDKYVLTSDGLSWLLAMIQTDNRKGGDPHSVVSLIYLKPKLYKFAKA